MKAKHDEESVAILFASMRVYLFQNSFVPKKTAFAVFFCRVGELYFQVQHLKKKEKVHIDLWYNRLSQKNTHQGEIYELQSSYHRRALLYTRILQKR